MNVVNMCCLAIEKPPGTEVPKGLGGYQYKVFNCPATKQILEWDKKVRFFRFEGRIDSEGWKMDR